MSKEKDTSNWMQTLWRPMMGWMYMLICLLDMAVFPVLWALWQGINHVPITQWNPLTLQGAGLFHIAMGAVLGISAFGRTQEKLAGTAANPTATEQISVNTTNMSGVPAGGMGNMNNNMGGGFNNNTSGGFGSNSFGSPPTGFGQPTGFGTPTPAFGSTALGGNTASAFGSTTTGAFGSGTPTPSTGFGQTSTYTPPAPAPVTGQVAATSTGKPAPVPAPDPEL